MSTFKTNDNVEIYYEVKGEGKPLFMLPLNNDYYNLLRVFFRSSKIVVSYGKENNMEVLYVYF